MNRTKMRHQLDRTLPDVIHTWFEYDTDEKDVRAHVNAFAAAMERKYGTRFHSLEVETENPILTNGFIVHARVLLRDKASRVKQGL